VSGSSSFPDATSDIALSVALKRVNAPASSTYAKDNASYAAYFTSSA
jgi:hypothetical protein